MAKLDIGVVGAGYMGSLHAKILLQDERVRVTAIYDVMPERAKALAQECAAQTAESVDALIETVEAVFITTPNTRHVETTLKALAAERHIFCEKPLATWLEEARQVLGVDVGGTLHLEPSPDGVLCSTTQEVWLEDPHARGRAFLKRYTKSLQRLEPAAEA